MIAKLSAFLAALPLAAAWPQVMEMSRLQRREEPPPREPLFKSGRPNTGDPAVGFNADDQFVNVTQGSGHEWAAPLPGQLRGQCPGLNAAANHGFLPRNGIVNMEQSVFLRSVFVCVLLMILAIRGLADAYNVAQDQSLFLYVVSTALSGDPIAGTWSIGGSFPASVPLFKPTGLLGTHNKYEVSRFLRTTCMQGTH